MKKELHSDFYIFLLSLERRTTIKQPVSSKFNPKTVQYTYHIKLNHRSLENFEIFF